MVCHRRKASNKEVIAKLAAKMYNETGNVYVIFKVCSSQWDLIEKKKAIENKMNYVEVL